MDIQTKDTVVVSIAALREISCALFERVGLEATGAKQATEPLLDADMRGIASHGCARLPVYIERLQKGYINAVPHIRVLAHSMATTLLDGDNGLGMVVATTAMEHAIEQARVAGASFVGVRQSNHFGAGAYYAAMALPHDMIGVVLTVSNLNTMAPWGGVDRLLGNNPIACAIPTWQEPPVIYDGALSVVALATIHLLAHEGVGEIPDGWALDKNGAPTQSIEEAQKGTLVPIGTYKGTSLAFLISLVAGALTGAAFGSEVADRNVGHCFIAISVRAFSDPSQFRKKVDRAVREIREAKTRNTAEPPRVPGEQGLRMFENARKTSQLTMSLKTIERIRALAATLGVAASGI